MSDTADTTETAVGVATDTPQSEAQSTASAATASPPDDSVPEATVVLTAASTTVPRREDEVSTPTQSNPFPVPPSADQGLPANSSDGESPSNSAPDEEESLEERDPLATLTPENWDELQKSQAHRENENAAAPTGQSSEPNTPDDDHPAA